MAGERHGMCELTFTHSHLVMKLSMLGTLYVAMTREEKYTVRYEGVLLSDGSRVRDSV
jgi:hypothetical protein